MAWDQAQDGWGQTGSSGAGTTTTGAVLAATTQQTRTLLTQDPTYTLTWTGSGLRVAIVGLTTGTTHDIQIGTIVVQRIRHDAAVV